MELGVLLVLAIVGLGLGWFWVSGTTSGELRMMHRS